MAALNAECPAQLEIGRGPRCLSAAASFPNRTTYGLGDSGPSSIDQRAVVDAGFLKLVRLGIKPADDGVIINSLKVVDTQLATTTPNGIFWHRYNFDGYGETEKGGPWGVNPADSFITRGRLWVIFAGERGEYDLAGNNVFTKIVRLLNDEAGVVERELSRLRGFCVAVRLIELNALAARTISHSLMEISAMLAEPDRSNFEQHREDNVRNHKRTCFFRLVPSCFPSAVNNAPRRSIGCIDRSAEIAEPIGSDSQELLKQSVSRNKLCSSKQTQCHKN